MRGSKNNPTNRVKATQSGPIDTTTHAIKLPPWGEALHVCRPEGLDVNRAKVTLVTGPFSCEVCGGSYTR